VSNYHSVVHLCHLCFFSSLFDLSIWFDWLMFHTQNAATLRHECYYLLDVLKHPIPLYRLDVVLKHPVPLYLLDVVCLLLYEHHSFFVFITSM
jgi:hypothetical protein